MNKPEFPGKFCALAWVHRFTNIGGEIQVCCSSEEHGNDIRSDDGSKMHILNAGGDDRIMNSRYMKELRLQMLRGEWPTPCERCRMTEQTGGVSRRMDENNHFKEAAERLLARTEADGTIPIEIKSSDFRVGNLCNLACRMCSPRSSSLWARSWDQVDQSVYMMSEELKKEYQSYDWYKSPDFSRQFKEQIATLDHLHFAGGEPLVLPEMVTLLETCVESGHAKHIELTYNTNVTKISDRIKELWPHFKAVKLLCSVDGFGKMNEYIRYPSSWETIDKNLRDLDSHFDEYGLKDVLIMTTVQAYNVLHLEELFDYTAGLKRICRMPKLVDLHYPLYYRTQILPQPLKAEARIRLMRILEKSQGRIRDGLIPDKDSHCLAALRGAIGFLENEDMQGEIPAFLRAAGSVDRMRNQSLYDVVPEFRTLAAP